jgi:hypothetical protein
MAAPDEEPAPDTQPLAELLFKDFHISIVQLWGGMIGAGIAILITQNMWHYWSDASQNGYSAVALGLYALLTACVGTWTALGLFGRVARRNGGRILQTAVQVVGIAVAAMITLPGAIIATILLMWLHTSCRSFISEVERRHAAEQKTTPPEDYAKKTSSSPADADE